MKYITDTGTNYLALEKLTGEISKGTVELAQSLTENNNFFVPSW